MNLESLESQLQSRQEQLHLAKCLNTCLLSLGTLGLANGTVELRFTSDSFTLTVSKSGECPSRHVFKLRTGYGLVASIKTQLQSDLQEAIRLTQVPLLGLNDDPSQQVQDDPACPSNGVGVPHVEEVERS